MGLFDGTPLERPVRCEECNEVISACTCPDAEEPTLPPSSQRLKIRVERRKHGRVVTSISGFSGSSQQIDLLLQKLKSQCGAGGTRIEQSIEIQGDHFDRIKNSLQTIGYKIT